MAKCDLCGGSCDAHSLNQLREPYRVPGVVDLCPACAKWADKTKDDMAAEIGPRMRAAVAARRYQSEAPSQHWLRHAISRLKSIFVGVA